MAPHRLRRKDVRALAGEYPNNLRFRVIAHTPTIFIDYLLEILFAAMGLIVGAAYFSGFLSEASIARRLPTFVGIGYAVSLIVGAGTIIIGLAVRRFGTALPMGLGLIATSGVAYTVAVWWYVGPRMALVTILMSIIFAALAAWRSFILRSTFVLLASQSEGEGAGSST